MTAASHARMFVALWPDDATRVALARCRDAWSWPAGAPPQADDRLHLTLHFIGDVPRNRLPELGDALRLPFDTFALTLDAFGRWSHGVAVLLPTSPPLALDELHGRLRDRIDALGFATESRRLRPHVTLSRRAGDAPVPEPPPPVAWRIDRFALVETLAGSGDYRVACRYGCDGSAAG